MCVLSLDCIQSSGPGRWDLPCILHLFGVAAEIGYSKSVLPLKDARIPLPNETNIISRLKAASHRSLFRLICKLTGKTSSASPLNKYAVQYFNNCSTGVEAGIRLSLQRSSTRNRLH